MPRVLWQRRDKPNNHVSRALGIERWELREALHTIKAQNGLGGADLVVIYDDGCVEARREFTLATSWTRSETGAPPARALATLRFAGETLDPDELTAILGIEPTLKYRRGEAYQPGPRSPKRTEPVGCWFLSTKGMVRSHELEHHLGSLAGMIAAEPGGLRSTAKLESLQRFVRPQHIRPVVTCFWSGRPGAKKPAIAPAFSHLVEQIGGEIETDFADDLTQPKRHRAEVA